MTDMLYVGRRLSYAGARCTVRYIGQVQGTNGDWLGVEWDDPTKGKHDGSHNGVKYFDCHSESSTAASFVRPTRPHDAPRGFLEALAAKYAQDEEALSSSQSQILISGKVVEEVGFEEIRQQLATVHELRIVLLDGLCIVGVLGLPWIGSSELHLQERQRVARQNLKIVELDLSRNLIEKWVDVASICVGLKSLRILKLNGNRFREESAGSLEGDQEPFKNVEELSLDDTLLSWTDIVKFTSFFPSLTSLSASSNNISTITTPLSTPGLKILTLNSNAFHNITDFSFLTSLPCLTRLSLRSNPLKTVASQVPLVFPNLTYLDLTLTLLPSVADLSPLASTFPSLTAIVTNKTPLAIAPSSSLFTIARLPSLTSLNHSIITPAERQNAELYYLSLIARELSAATSEEATHVLHNHPRYRDLCEKYGEPELVTKARAAWDPEAGTLGARIVRFTFWMESDGATGADRAIVEKEKDIPRTIDIYQLKGIVGRLFGIRPLGCGLVWETGEWDPVKGEEDGWSCSEDEELEMREEVREHPGSGGPDIKEPDKAKRPGKWTRREIELVDSTRDIGFWIEGREARVRVERR